jgi:capsular exopolysaccharide synthesis family protein
MKHMKSTKQSSNSGTADLLRLFLGRYPAKSRYAEAFRTLRTNVHFSFMEKDFQSLLITSAGAGEGKSSTAANLAYAVAQAGKSVLLIDADLRKPFLSRAFSSDGSAGLTGLLSDVFGTDVREGTLDQYGIHDLLMLLSLKKKTGILSLSGGGETIELFFLQGEMADLNWPTRPDQKKLLNTLTRANMITGDQAKLAVSRQKDTGQKLGFVLVSMGLLSGDDLAGPLAIHMMEGLRVALQLKKGTFTFKDLPESDFERASFDPVDFNQIYRQVMIGEEELPYLQKRIQAAILETGVENLSLLPAGNLPTNPSELLGSKRMSFLLSNLKKRFDTLIIDSPPILPASDALLLGPQMDGVVLVVKSGMMNREMVRKAVEQIRLSQANLLGVVLNAVDTKREGYYKYYHKYYSKYYGHDA